jgi:hypothetical protein
LCLPFGFLKSATTGKTRILFNMDDLDCRMIGYSTRRLPRITPHKDDLILFVPRRFRHGIKARSWALLKDKTRP